MIPAFLFQGFPFTAGIYCKFSDFIIGKKTYNEYIKQQTEG